MHSEEKLSYHLDAVGRYSLNYGSALDPSTFDELTGSTLNSEYLLNIYYDWDIVTEKALSRFDREKTDAVYTETTSIDTSEHSMTLRDPMSWNYPDMDQKYKLLRQAIYEEEQPLLPVEFDIWCLEDVTSDDLIEDAGSWKKAIENADHSTKRVVGWSQKQIGWILNTCLERTEKSHLSWNTYEKVRDEYFISKTSIKERYGQRWKAAIDDFGIPSFKVNPSHRNRTLAKKIREHDLESLNSNLDRKPSEERLNDIDRYILSILEEEKEYFSMQDVNDAISRISSIVEETVSFGDYTEHYRYTDPHPVVALELCNHCWSQFDEAASSPSYSLCDILQWLIGCSNKLSKPVYDMTFEDYASNYEENQKIGITSTGTPYEISFRYLKLMSMMEKEDKTDAVDKNVVL